MNRPDIDENELVSMLGENDENVKNIIYEKYGYIIDILIKKYSRLITMLQIDEQEIRCEASYGFSDGINSYSEHKNTSITTFLSLCIERRIQKFLTKKTSKKALFLQEVLSLDYAAPGGETPLIELISDDNQADPLNNLTFIETFEEIITIAKEHLSDFEYQVFTYMIQEVPYLEIARELEKTPKQIDNTIQRIKIKMRKILSKS